MNLFKVDTKSKTVLVAVAIAIVIAATWGYGTQHSWQFQFAANDTQNKFFIIAIKYAEGPRTSSKSCYF